MGEQTTSQRLEQLRDAVRELLDSGNVEGVLALRIVGPGPAPHLFHAGDDLSDLALWPKYQIPKLLDMLLAANPDVRLGVVIRGCEERGLIELAKHNQVDMDRIEWIGLACTAEERDECRCHWPYPSRIDMGEKVEGIADALVKEHADLSLEERMDFWRRQFSRCIKCYACRTACPQCFCESCMLEDDKWVETGVMTPAFPSYHLIRAYHTVGKCVGCMECEKACPAGIPLTVLYKLLHQDAEELFGYVPGASVEDLPPLVIEDL